MRIRACSAMLLLLSGIAVAQNAPEVKDADLSKDNPPAVRATAGKPLKLRLLNLVPDTAYSVSDGRETRDVKAPAPAADKEVTLCNGTKKKVSEVLANATTEKKIADAIATVLPQDCPAAAKTALENALREHTSATIAEFTLGAGDQVDRTVKRGTTQWQIFLAAAPAVDVALKDLLERTKNHSSLITRECPYTTGCPDTPVFINADQISAVYITGITHRLPLTVRVTAGEYFPCEALRYNFAQFEVAPDALMIPIHLRRGRLGIFGNTMGRLSNEAAARYGLDACPDTGEPFSARANAIDRAKQAYSTGTNQITPEVVADAFQRTGIDPRSVVRDRFNPRGRTDLDIPQVPLFVRGRSELITVQLDFEGGEVRTFTVPLRYQRFWLDAGGFFVFSRRTDQLIELETIPATTTTAEMRKVKAIRNDTTTEPVTGIVLNIHPGNYPVWAFQFGIAAAQNRLPSYYLGIGVRAREIGKRGLATLAVGVAMQQEDRFPHVKAGSDDQYAPGDTRLQASKKYGFFFPYVSLSFGFSFGGVSEGTNVAGAVGGR